MVRLRNQFLWTFRSQGLRILILKCMWIAIMLEISHRFDQGQDSLSTGVWICYSGYPRKKRQFKHHFLVRNVWWWSTEWKHSEASSTSWGWWEFRFPGLNTSMGKICQLSTKLSDRSLIWRKIVTQFIIMQFWRELWQRSHWRLTFQQITILGYDDEASHRSEEIKPHWQHPVWYIWWTHLVLIQDTIDWQTWSMLQGTAHPNCGDKNNMFVIYEQTGYYTQNLT